MSYQYFGVFCSGQVIPLWNAPAPSGPTAGVPVMEIDKPLRLHDCPGCHKEHIFRPEELKLYGLFDRQVTLHEFETIDEE